MKSISEDASKVQHFQGISAAFSGPQGGESGNTHLANRQGLETGGEDTAVLSFGVAWRDNFEPLMKAIEGAKEQAKASHSMVSLQFGGRLLGVHPSGKSSGGGRGTYYRYRVETAGYSFQITGQAGPCEKTPNVIVEIGSEVLMALGGLRAAYEEVKAIIVDLGGFLLWDKLSRVDMCVDLPGVDVADFVNPVLQHRAVTRAREKDYHENGERWTGVTIGRGDILVRAYDKLFEVTVSKADPEKYRLLCAYRWGGCPRTATRVEFQLRREALKGFGIDAVSDYFEKLPAMLNYLTSEWFRLVASMPDRDNNNTARAETHPLWLTVCKAFQAWAGATRDVSRRIKRRFHRDPIRLVKQAAGCLMSAVSDLVDGRVVSPSEFVSKATECIDFGVNLLTESQFYGRYQSKALPVLVGTAL